MALPLDETISTDQAGHIADHQDLAIVANAVGRSGTGSPEAAVTAPVGTVYRDTAATNGAILWIKATGSGNTGWKVAYGDTGWRKVPSLLVNSWTAVEMRLRRVNNVAYIQIDQLSPASASGDVCISDFPAGFRPYLAYRALLLAGDSGSTVVNLYVTDAGTGIVRVLGYNTGHTSYRGSGSWAVDAAWPSSLPGTA